MNRKDVLTTATNLVTGDRADAYGPAAEHFDTVAAMWSQIIGVDIRPDQVTMCLTLLKMVRANHDPARPDNWVDMAGYASLGSEVAYGDGPHPVPVAVPEPIRAATTSIDIVLPPDPVDDDIDESSNMAVKKAKTVR